ncbi:MAG: hypothetical protein HPY53_04395 [Brevinematales bacterium]|nr:hypothetical protein [Brevinematales bacterium]
MKRFLLLGVAAVLFMGCTITFDTGNNDTNNNPALVVTVTSPTNNSVFLTNGFLMSGTVTGGEVNIAGVYVKVMGGSYTYVSGTSNLIAATAQAWNYNIAGAPTGTVAIYIKAVDMMGNTSAELTRTVYIGSGGTLAPTLSITSPANFTYFEVSDGTIPLIGTVQDDGALDYVYARWGASSTGVYAGVSGTHLISPAVATAWTNSFNISSYSGGSKMMWAYAKDLSGMHSSTNGVMVYLLDEEEPNNGNTIADLMPSDATWFYARTGVANDVDWFKFNVPTTGFYIMMTTNADMGTPLDTTMVIYDQNGTTILDQNDDAYPGNTYSWLNHNFTSTGDYYISIARYDTNGIGDYAVVVYKP